MFGRQQKKSRKLGTGARIAIAVVGVIVGAAGSYTAGSKQLGKSTAGKATGFVKNLLNRSTNTNTEE